ncbi:MAG TPA: hypothetical protein VLJ86_20135 [Ramlibacter sp.]|nr:hypothetical protein [Ramlibacter sp.]
MTAWLVWPGVLVCALVIAACICRIDMMRTASHQGGWIALYILWAPFALGVLIDLLQDRAVDWWACFGLAGILTHMVLTRRLWKNGAPPETLKGRT